MFKSKVRAINVPQYEHGRLAGVFAYLWGNEAFDRPALDFASFVQGVALHDWHYSPIDDLPIGEAGEAEWLTLFSKGAAYWFTDPVTDIVAKLHLKRLVSRSDSAEMERLASLVEARIVERLPETGFSREQFEWADRITRFCDDLAFHFSFELPVVKTTTLYSRVGSRKETAVTYEIRANGEISIKPWPFSPPSFAGIIMGYERAGYPEKLLPQVLPFRCQPGTPRLS